MEHWRDSNTNPIYNPRNNPKEHRKRLEELEI